MAMYFILSKLYIFQGLDEITYRSNPVRYSDIGELIDRDRRVNFKTLRELVISDANIRIII